MRISIAFALVALLAVALASPAAADGSSNWKVYTYAPSDRTLSSKQADEGNSFTFASTPDTALFAVQRPEGNTSLAGRTITATFRIDAPAGTTFHYSGEGTAGNPCGTPATVRLYFSSNGPMGSKKDWYSNFWWSRSAGSFQQLADGTFQVTANVSPGSWSNWNGKLDTERPDGFAAAAADPDLVGFSFGGGCFYENGVGTTGGDATFTLLTFTIN